MKKLLMSLIFFFSSACLSSYALDIYDSGLQRFQSYGEKWYNSAGQKIGIRVRYSIGGLLSDPSKPSNYAAVCVFNQQGGGTPCLEAGARVWTRNTQYNTLGQWVIQNIPRNCNNSAIYQSRFLSPIYLAVG